MKRGLPANGILLRLLALGHAVVGTTVYRKELRSIARDGVVAGVPYRGPKATAFWFLMPTPLMWLIGRLVSGAEESGDAATLRSVHRVSMASAAVAILCMPLSGFWGWLAISTRGLLDARRAPR